MLLSLLTARAIRAVLALGGTQGEVWKVTQDRDSPGTGSLYGFQLRSGLSHSHRVKVEVWLTSMNCTLYLIQQTRLHTL